MRISFFTGEAVFAAVWILLRIAVWIRQRKICWKREAQLLLMYVNLAVIIRMSFFPMMRIDGKVQPLVFDIGSLFPLKINLIPFVYLLDYDSKIELLLNTIGNVAMFIPTGILFPILYEKLDSFRKVLCNGFLLSASIETLQLPFHVRTTDIDDLILNTLGVMIGYWIYTAVRSIGSHC